MIAAIDSKKQKGPRCIWQEQKNSLSITWCHESLEISRIFKSCSAKTPRKGPAEMRVSQHPSRETFVSEMLICSAASHKYLRIKSCQCAPTPMLSAVFLLKDKLRYNKMRYSRLRPFNIWRAKWQTAKWQSCRPQIKVEEKQGTTLSNWFASTSHGAIQT